MKELIKKLEWINGPRQSWKIKHNEIIAIPDLFKGLDVKGQIITIDAMGTQKK